MVSTVLWLGVKRMISLAPPPPSLTYSCYAVRLTGWCDSSCVSGTSSGSNNGVCSSSSGNWDWGACGVECDQNVDCSSCTETSGCGALALVACRAVRRLY